jgi:PadR family transcriptional regulator PadR
MNPRLVEPGFIVVCLHVDGPARPGKDEYGDEDAKRQRRHGSAYLTAACSTEIPVASDGPAGICRSERYRHRHMAVPKSELPQGTLDMLILQVVALGPIHGYAITQRIQQISRDALQVLQGSLYPALHRLENKGLMAAEWRQTESGREAKFYRLTTKGRSQLKAETANWARLSDAIGLILKSAEGEGR